MKVTSRNQSRVASRAVCFSLTKPYFPDQASGMALILILLLFVLGIIYRWWCLVYKKWDRRNVPNVPGVFPFGSDHRLSLMTTHQGRLVDEMYKKFSSQPYFGIYMIRSPFLVIRSPEIISIVLTKEFSHFRNRQFLKIHKSDFILQHLFNFRGDEWRALRVKLSPTFSSTKLKAMIPLFIKCTENLQSFLLKQPKGLINVKESLACYSTDVIGSCAFGFEGNVLSNSGNQLRKMGLRATDLNLLILLKVAIKMAFPEFALHIPIKVFTNDIEKFYLKLFKDIVDYREEKNLRAPDFIDLLIQLKKKKMVEEGEKIGNGESNNHSKDMTLELIVAQCFFFFVAGFENSSSIQTYCLYELALNPEIQKKLQNEIDVITEKHGGITYDGIKEMEYLDMVICETMRKYPLLPFLTRVCTTPLVLPDGFQIEKGDQILIPFWSLHYDSVYFPDPKKFDPERFSEENKVLIKPYTYMPFGEGPRICIGLKFGQLQTKIGIISILKNYNVEPTEETVIPIAFKGRSFTTLPQKPVYLKLVQRSSL